MNNSHRHSQPYTAILVDLDGTITDSQGPIMDALEKIFTKYNVPYDGRADLVKYIGPPLEESFVEYANFSPANVDEIIAEYRTAYEQTMLNTPVYDGIHEALQQLHEAGIPLGLATSKGEEFAITILEHVGLSQFFLTLTGADRAAGRSKKSEVVATALELLNKQNVDLSRVALVGDRKHDVEGAALCGIDSIAVEWGYGDDTEYATATHRVASPKELTEFLLPDQIHK